MRLKLAVTFLLAANLFGQPSQSDRYKYAPMVATARLWNMIRYQHPQLTGDSTAWDSALIAAIPKLEAVHSDEDLALALDALLQTLHDPCTRIALGLPGKGVTVQSMASDTMVIHAGNGDLAGTVGAGLMLKMSIPQTNNLVWDIRGTRLPFQLTIRPDVSLLSQNGVGYAFRQHSGYPPQDGAQSSYFSALQIVDPQPITGKPAAARKQVYLIDKDSAVPVQAIVDQIHGRTSILSEDPPSARQAGFTELVRVLGKVTAEVRVAELRYPDGTTEFAPTRVVLNRGEEAVKAAAGELDAGWGIPGERPKFLPGAAGFHDVPYADNPYPSRELRILAAFRLWGVLHYFDPYVALMGDQWDDILVEFLPKFSEAKDAAEYHQAVAQMAVRTGDIGCAVRSTELQGVFGPAAPPFEVRFIDNQPVVSRIFKSSPAQPGDIILKINGKPVQDRMAELSRYTAFRNQANRYLVSARMPGPVTLTVQRKGEESQDISVQLNDNNQKAFPAARGGDAIRLINEQIGYADMERVEAGELDAMFEKFSQTAAIILDMRGYPRDNALAIAMRLGDRNQPVIAELFRNVVGLGTGGGHIGFLQSELRVPRAAKPRRYMGKTVALIDDQYPSVTGENAMCLRAANNTILVGTPAFPLFSSYTTVLDVPGGIKVHFSGQIPRWPGGKLLYPDGVQPDVEARPTVAGLRAGKDEVLQAAVEYLAKEAKTATNEHQ
jgi:C-terminal processing protease CtpA/Prc